MRVGKMQYFTAVSNLEMAVQFGGDQWMGKEASQQNSKCHSCEGEIRQDARSSLQSPALVQVLLTTGLDVKEMAQLMVEEMAPHSSLPQYPVSLVFPLVHFLFGQGTMQGRSIG